MGYFCTVFVVVGLKNEERMKELGSLGLERVINIVTIKKTPVKNKLFSNSLLCFLILVHYTNMKNKIVSYINRHLRRNNWFKLQRKKSSIVIRKSFPNKIGNDV